MQHILIPTPRGNKQNKNKKYGSLGTADYQYTTLTITVITIHSHKLLRDHWTVVLPLWSQLWWSFLPFSLCFMAVLGLDVRRKSVEKNVWVFSKISAGFHFPSITRAGSHYWKSPHLPAVWGRRKEGEWRHEESALLRFKSSTSKLWFFGINS